MKILQTLFSRILILVLNFGLVIFTTNVWGSEGKGIIALMIANLSVVGFVTNIFVGSSISYFASRYSAFRLLTVGYLWSLIIGIVFPLFFLISFNREAVLFLIALSVTSALLSANISFFIGIQKMQLFNVFTFLQQAVLFGVLLLFYYGFAFYSVEVYFYAQIICNVLLFAFSLLFVRRHLSDSGSGNYEEIFSKMFHYGWKSQLSAFVQFLNNRSSYYFLEHFKGIASVGIYSVGVAISEAVWTISRSFALVLYSDLVNSDSHERSLLQTKFSLKLSFYLTLFTLIFIALIPESLFISIFGKDFGMTKKIMICLAPGILAIAVSNIVGFYFAGVNQLRILNIKSFAALFLTLLLSFLLVPKYGILGASMVTSLSYVLSTGILLWKFYKTAPFQWSDYWFGRSEIELILKKVKHRLYGH